ncbi:M14 family metallopeptidase [Vaginisenegalia massiliensis]|uniref:M14 family metallopeptidase n=1 Tax=Vaginisenegalia massiliensis TaxID=2058294 RepID=UPI000F5329EA|nr:M14 family metallopeptidase [Vaginisenegalia massiliensis]
MKDIKTSRLTKGLTSSMLALSLAAVAVPVYAQETTTTNATELTTVAPVIETTAVNAATTTTAPETVTSQETTTQALETITSEATTVVKPAANTFAAPTTPEAKVILTKSDVYMTEPKTVNVTANVGSAQASDFVWTLNGKPISEWQTWNEATGQWDSGIPLVTFDGQPTVVNGQLSADVKFNLMFGNEDLSRRKTHNLRRTYRQYIGQYELKAVNPTTGQEIILPINYRPYENYQSYEEMVAATDAIANKVYDDRYVTIEQIGTSAEGRPIRMGIIAQNAASISDYLNKTTPLMLEDPDQFMKLLAEGKIDYKVPVMINNTHADEQPGIDIVSSLFDTFASKDVIRYNTVDENNNPIVKEFSVPDLLKDVILLFNFTVNPDGAANNTRAVTNGMDPNRDTGYQTQPETRAIAETIAKYNPMSIMDFHGFVSEFLIEPCTPPHDPNFEFDLLYNNLFENANKMGRAGITNSAYDSYLIPATDWGSGWDDSFSGYTAVYGLYHGIMGHTIEVPATNQQSFLAGYYAGLAGTENIFSNKDALMMNRLKYYSRGIHKTEDPAANDALVEPDGSVKGRINQPGQTKFFPDYYVIPMSLDRQKNPDEAFKMIEYFKRNGVKVTELTQDMGEYKKGDLVIDMAQAKRGFANHILYPGANESEWDAMYAELVTNFPAMRGFDVKAIFQDGLFANKLGQVTWTQAPRTGAVADQSKVVKANPNCCTITSEVTKFPYVFVENNSAEATRAVNKALSEGKNIYLAKDGYYMDQATYNSLIKDFVLKGTGVQANPIGTALKPVKVYAPGNPNAGLQFPGHSSSYLALKEMGFQVVDSLDEADVIVVDNGDFDPSIIGKKPTIVFGGEAMFMLKDLLPGFDINLTTDNTTAWSYEGLIKADILKDNILASGFLANDLFYSNSGAWITAIPAGFESFIKAQTGDDFYVSGWWPGHDALKGQVLGIDGMFNGNPLMIFAGNPTNKTHTHNFYRWLSNAAFRGELAKLEEVKMETVVTELSPEDCLAYFGKEDDTKVPSLAKATKDSKVDSSAVLPATGEQNNSNVVIALGMLMTATGLMAVQYKRNRN